MPRVFICYRREDSAPYAGRLHDRLSLEFGAHNVFMDLESLGPGDVFDEHIRSAVDKTDVAVVVIGPQWLDVHDLDRRPRIWSEDDYVRREIAMALGGDVHVIPALVGRATLPKPEQLPGDIQLLPAFHAVELSDLRWGHDVGQLIEAIHRSEPKTKAGSPRWMAAVRTRRSRKAILWTYRILTPLISIGVILLLQTITTAAHISQTYTMVAMLLVIGVLGSGLTLIEKRFGGDRG